MSETELLCDYDDLSIESLNDCGLFAIELVIGCSRQRSLGQFTVGKLASNMYRLVLS